MRSRPIAALAITTAAVLALAGCSPSGSGEESGDTLKLWHYEGADSANHCADGGEVTRCAA